MRRIINATMLQIYRRLFTESYKKFNSLKITHFSFPEKNIHFRESQGSSTITHGALD